MQEPVAPNHWKSMWNSNQSKNNRKRDPQQQPEYIPVQDSSDVQHNNQRNGLPFSQPHLQPVDRNQRPVAPNLISLNNNNNNGIMSSNSMHQQCPAPVITELPWRRRAYYSPHVIGLHEEINDFYDFIKPIPEEEYMRTRVVERIESVVHGLWPEAKVEIFGSFATKLYLPTSDIDLMIMGKWNTLPMLSLRDKLVEAGVSDPENVTVLDKASVPIVKVIDKESGVRVDISFNTSNGVNSANLIKDYMKRFPCLAKLVMVLKQFLYMRQLNEVFTGGISSYSLILMTISFLQLHPREDAHSDKANLGVLLLEFFELYGHNFNYLKVGLRIRDGGCYVPKYVVQEQMESGYRPSILCIEDPLNPKNDIGKSSYGALNVKKAFDRAFLSLNQECGPANYDSNERKLSTLVKIISVPAEVVLRREQIRAVYGPLMKAVTQQQNFSRNT